MRVIAATLHTVRLPLVHEFQTSSHAKRHLDHILVELTDASGAVGWGEIASASHPFYGPETVETATLVAERYLLPALVGTNWEHPADAARSWAKVRGNEFAKAGVDMACWVLAAEASGRPLAELLGGTRDRAATGVSLGIEPTIDALVEQVSAQVEAGYRRVKLKIAPGWDVAPVAAVRAVYPDHDLHVDANGAYPADDPSFEVMRALDRYHLTMIEQPFAPRDFVGHARLQAQLETPVCLDEAVETLSDLETMIALGAGRVLNIKVSRLGGLTTSVAAHDRARQAGIPVWCGGMHEFGVGRAANVALSSLPGFTLPSDVSGSDKYYARDVITPPVETTDDGYVPIPTRPGLGFDVDTEWVAANTLSTIHVEE
ncbi:o-succinylbenzoate synthase [Propionicimonas sp.]|uniref:o-succinylbenzoate synthase n=1 Tax=Propionicimonas sp. TaxID=1955623 RepID=UPI0039E59E51